MHSFVISQLLDAGLSQNQISVFEENEINTQDFCELTVEDLRILFPNKLGIVKKVSRVIQQVSTILSQSQSRSQVQTQNVNEHGNDNRISGNVSDSDSGCSESDPTELETERPKMIPPPVENSVHPMISPKPKTEIQPNHDDLNNSNPNPNKKSAVVVVDLPIKRRLTVSKKNQQILRSILRFKDDSPLFQMRFFQIDYPKWNDADLSDDQIRITALPTQMSQAISEIQKILEDIKQFESKTLTIDKPLHKYVIGAGGKNIREVYERTGVLLEVPSSNSDNNRVILTGLPKNLSIATDIVRSKYARFIPTVASQPKPKEMPQRPKTK